MSPSAVPPHPSGGDDGRADLPGGLRLPKSDPLMEALGTLDELNAALGLLRAQQTGTPDAGLMESIQRNLMQIGGELATGQPRLDAAAVAALEHETARHTEGLPPWPDFVLPGSNETSARAHWARAVCRRAERELVRAQGAHPERVYPQALAYLNRLSSLLFAVAQAPRD